MQELPARKPNRLKDYDYSLNGAYFVTICSKKRIELFADVVVGAAFCRPSMQLTDIGKIIEKETAILSQTYEKLNVDCYVVMPNHVHMIIIIKNDDSGQNAAPTISCALGQWKREISIKCGFSVWQKSFHDRIIRNQKEYDYIANYIEINQENWEKDCFYKNNNKTGEKQNK